MALRGLALYAYNPNTNQIGEYGNVIEELAFSTITPGGFGDLTCRLRVPDGRFVPPELRVFSLLALMDGTFAAFQGRWDEPGMALGSNGDQLTLHALGAASVLKDDPDDAAYSDTTAQSVIGQEMTRRAAYLRLDQDTSQLLPDAPTALFSPAFQGRDLEEEINELTPVLGDYQWQVWDHARNRDAANFPTWQLYWHKRDTTTIAYTATTDDQSSHDIRPAVEYSYNVVTLHYRDSATNLPSYITVRDSRLNADGSQGTAPFPWRRLRKDMSATHLTSTQAATVANALLAQYQNTTYKITIDLHSVRDAYGNPLPLWRVRADGNIYMPDLSPMGQQLPMAPTPGVNLFYITETHYSEAAGAAPRLTLICDTFHDTAAFQIARLQYHAEHKVRATKRRHTIREPGNSEEGYAGATFAGVPAGSIVGIGSKFKTTMSAAPTSITLTQISANNVSALGVNSITNFGFNLYWTAPAGGNTYYLGHYVTHGN